MARWSTASTSSVLAWRDALEQAKIELSVWRIHRRIGMSGGLFLNALTRETGKQLSPEEAGHLRELHAEAYVQRMRQVRPLPGATRLLRRLTDLGVPWAIATSGSVKTASPAIAMLEVQVPVVITREDVAHAKPDPDLFLAAAERLGVSITHSIVGGRQRLGPAGRAACSVAGRRAPLRRLWPGGIAASRCLPRL